LFLCRAVRPAKHTALRFNCCIFLSSVDSTALGFDVAWRNLGRA
jgi:hypothetical protein